jgi:undecaprenyl-diphosphatase
MLYFYLLIIVQIVLESFPVSSSGHGALLELFLSSMGIQNNFFIDLNTPSTFQTTAYDAVLFHFLHGPTLIIVALFFFNRWWPLLRSLIKRWYTKSTHYKKLVFLFCKISYLTLSADCCTTVLYYAFGTVNINHIPMGVGFCITALLLISLRFISPTPHTPWNLRIAIVLGIVQGIALIPGISRFAATLVAGRYLGLAPHKAFEISLLIQWPLMVAAFSRSFWLLCDHHALGVLCTLPFWIIIIGAGIIAYKCLCWSAHLFYTNKLWWFGIYMIVPIAFWLLVH